MKGLAGRIGARRGGIVAQDEWRTAQLAWVLTPVAAQDPFRSGNYHYMMPMLMQVRPWLCRCRHTDGADDA